MTVTMGSFTSLNESAISFIACEDLKNAASAFDSENHSSVTVDNVVP
jgi:hypothetical protein